MIGNRGAGGAANDGAWKRCSAGDETVECMKRLIADAVQMGQSGMLAIPAAGGADAPLPDARDNG